MGQSKPPQLPNSNQDLQLQWNKRKKKVSCMKQICDGRSDLHVLILREKIGRHFKTPKYSDWHFKTRGLDRYKKTKRPGQELWGDPWKPSMCITPPTTKFMCGGFITLLCESENNFEGWICVACSRQFDCDPDGLVWKMLHSKSITVLVLLKQSVSVTK